MSEIKAKSIKVARVIEGETEFIMLERLVDGKTDKSMIDMTAHFAEQLSHMAELSNLVPHVASVMQGAYAKLKDQFSDRVSAVANSTMIHDGQIVIRIQPAAGMFDMALSRDLNRFSWELQDELADLVGEDSSPMLFGFRQEFPGVEEEFD